MKLRLIPLAMLVVLIFASCRDQLNGPPANSSPSLDTVAYWTFDGNALDVSGHGHNGTMSGNYDYNLSDRFGNYGKAVEVIGLGQMNTQSMPNFSDSDSYTVSFWVNLTAGGTLVSPNYGFGADSAEFGADPQGCGLITSTQPLGTDRWRLVTVAVSAFNSATLYIDSIAEVTKPYGSYTGTNDSIPMQIVFNQASTTDTVRLDDAVVLHYCLSASQVTSRFHEGGWYEH
jgi:hypothetical protein